MGKLSRFRIDPTRASEGVLVEFGEGIRMRIARGNNNRAREYLAELQRPHLDAIRAGTFPDAEWEEMQKLAAARFVLIGWENMDDDSGAIIPYSEEKALEILRDPAYADVWDFVKFQANNRDNYREKVFGESLGNSPTGSNGVSHGEPTSQS